MSAAVAVSTVEKMFTTPCCARMMSAVRSGVVEFARRLPFDEEKLGDIALAVGEALSNAYRHGCVGGSSVVTVSCRISQDVFMVSVRDRGNGFDVSQVERRDPASLVAGGRGIFFMGAVMDELTIESGPEGTNVMMAKRVQHPGDLEGSK